MRRLFWITWAVLGIVAVLGFIRPVAVDVQLTGMTWFQVATADGSIRVINVRADASVSPHATIVIDREKNTYRNLVFARFWGEYVHYPAVADEVGTTIDTYRVDVPLTPILTLIVLCAWALAAARRWGMPWRLLWAQLRHPPSDGRPMLRMVRRGVCLVLMMLTLVATVLWVGSRIVPRTWWVLTSRDIAAEVRRVADPGASTIIGDDIAAFMQGQREAAKALDDKLTRPGWRFGVMVELGRLAVHVFTAVDAKAVTASTRSSWAGFRYETGPASAFGLRRIRPWPMLGGTPAAAPNSLVALQRVVEVPFWALVLLLGLWPILAFVRGPLRRAKRQSLGCCLHCGYNLSGLINPRCPECGHAAELVIPIGQHEQFDGPVYQAGEKGAP